MKAIVSDSGPLRYLINCKYVDLPGRMFEAVWVPEEIIAELGHPSAPEVVRDWVKTPPVWLRREAVASGGFDPGHDVGELAAIDLAQRIGVQQLLCNDMAARRRATAAGLNVFGTLGLLELAATNGFVDLREALGRLGQTNFRMTADLAQLLLKRADERLNRD